VWIVARSLHRESAGSNDDRQTRIGSANSLDEMYTGETWHIIVGNQQIVVAVYKREPSLLAIGSSVHDSPGVPQKSSCERAQDCIVFRNKNSAPADQFKQVERVFIAWIIGRLESYEVVNVHVVAVGYVKFMAWV
jgi:hypothetical protein